MQLSAQGTQRRSPEFCLSVQLSALQYSVLQFLVTYARSPYFASPTQGHCHDRSLPSPGKQADQFLLPGWKEGSARLQSQETQTSSQPAGSGTWSQQEGPHASGKEGKGRPARSQQRSSPRRRRRGLPSRSPVTYGLHLRAEPGTAGPAGRRAGGRRSLLTQRRVGGGGERTERSPALPAHVAAPRPRPRSAPASRVPGHRTAQPRCYRAPARPAPCRGPGGGPPAPGARESRAAAGGRSALGARFPLPRPRNGAAEEAPVFGPKLRLKGCESRPWNRHWKATFSLLTPPRPLS